MKNDMLLATCFRRIVVRVALGLCAAGLMACVSPALGALPPNPPQTFSSPYVAPTGRQILVNAGGDLQAAINAANLGDTIVLQAGATFAGPITLPSKTSGSGWIYIQSSAYASLPTPGNRVSPVDAVHMPKITAPAGGTGLQSRAGAHNYRFVGIEFLPVAGQFVYQQISLGSGDTSASTLPYNITIDRCYIHGDASAGGRRGVEMDAMFVAVLDSYVSGFFEVGADTQALWAYNSPGPYKIVDNYLEAAGENVMFGGADPAIQNSVPSDIEIRDNTMFKPLAWVTSKYQVKNLLEFKNAQRVLVTHNLFQNNWRAAQNGFSLLLTPRNQDGAAPWTVVQDVAYTYNVLVNGGSGFNLSGSDDLHPSQRGHRVLIRNNLVQLSGLNGANGITYGIGGGLTDLVIDHNTTFTINTGNADIIMTGGGPNPNFVFTNNISQMGAYGVMGTGTGDGINTLATYYPGAVFTSNALIGEMAGSYPAGNFFPAGIAAVGFANHAAGDYALGPGSPYRGKATDGRDLGADMSGLAGAGGSQARPMASGGPVVH